MAATKLNKVNFDFNLINRLTLILIQDPTKVITSFNEVPEAIRDESIRMVDLLRSMPHQITSKYELRSCVHEFAHVRCAVAHVCVNAKCTLKMVAHTSLVQPRACEVRAC